MRFWRSPFWLGFWYGLTHPWVHPDSDKARAWRESKWPTVDRGGKHGT